MEKGCKRLFEFSSLSEFVDEVSKDECSNIQSRLAEDKDLFAIYDVLKSTKLNTVLDSSQMRIGLSLNRIRNYLFSYDVIFCISTNKNNDIVEIAAFELSPQMFVGNEVKLFVLGIFYRRTKDFVHYGKLCVN